MASYSDPISVHATLTANTVDTVTLTGNKIWFRPVHRTAGGADIWWTWSDTGVAPTDPVVGANGTYNLPAGAVDREWDQISRGNESSIIVKLISTGAVTYSVESR